MVIYIDVLLALNLFVNYFLLLGSGLLARRRIRRLRLLLGAAAGSLSSLLILLPDMGTAFSAGVKLILGALLVRLAFAWEQRGVYCKTLAAFWGVNLLFGGAMVLLWLALSPPGMLVNNGVPYVAVSPLVLIVGSLAGYGLVRLVNLLLSRRAPARSTARVQLWEDGAAARTTALLDSGNQLVDPFSGLPVVVWEYTALAGVLPEAPAAFFCDPSAHPEALTGTPWEKRVRLVPCHTVGGSGLLPAFLPERFAVDGQPRRVCVAVTTHPLSDGEYHAVLPTGD